MNGIVLWSCPETWQAIIWCEDHADLAHACGETCFVAGAAFPEEGDLIICDVSAGEDVRQACAVRLLMRGALPDAAAILRSAAQQVPAEVSARAKAPVPVPTVETPARAPHLVVVPPAPGRRPRLQVSPPRPRPVLQLAVAS